MRSIRSACERQLRRLAAVGAALQRMSALRPNETFRSRQLYPHSRTSGNSTASDLGASPNVEIIPAGFSGFQNPKYV